MSIMLHVGYDINEFLGFEMDSPELKIAEHVQSVSKSKIHHLLNYVSRKKEIPRISFIFWVGPTSRQNLTLNC
jgi:hypothetical protein